MQTCLLSQRIMTQPIIIDLRGWLHMKKSLIAVILVCCLAFAGIAACTAVYVTTNVIMPIFNEQQKREKQIDDAFGMIFKFAEQSDTSSGNYKGPYLHNSYD